MKLSALIGMKLPDGTIRAISLHGNSYAGNADAILGGWYRTPEQVTALLELGDLIELRETPEECVAYHGPQSPSKTYAGKEDFRRRGKEDANYLYLYEGGEWKIFGLYKELGWLRIEVQRGKENKDA